MDSGSGINLPKGSMPRIPDPEESEPKPPWTSFSMPKIARTWNELNQMLQSIGARGRCYRVIQFVTSLRIDIFCDTELHQIYASVEFDRRTTRFAGLVAGTLGNEIVQLEI
jgi:hypothetical protein